MDLGARQQADVVMGRAGMCEFAQHLLAPKTDQIVGYTVTDSEVPYRQHRCVLELDVSTL